MTENLETLRFAVIDVEGNGQQPPEIVEIAILAMDGLVLTTQPRTWLVKPSQPITPLVTRKVHGIKNSDVKDAPWFTEIASEIQAILSDRIPVAHNARIDHEVLSRQLPTWEPALVVDTLRLARALWPGLKSYSLDPLLAHARIDTSSLAGCRHRAGFDAHATALLFATLAKLAVTRDQLLSLGCLPNRAPAAPPDEGVLF
ncbi:MAG TPA: 3'-5' exonuclease [Micromonosporaceae bacterium]|nr:3'-5' exonuclease [Micromonosporaceae bacterium]HCU51942.1 3'-5' exonuclease [Micromonosporaceae bacterium]